MPEKTEPAQIDSSFYSLVPSKLHERISRHWHDWSEACHTIEKNPQTEVDLSQLGKIWACSEFAALTMVRNPELWFELLEKKALEQSYTLEDYRTQLNQRLETNPAINDFALMKQLRLFRQQQMLRIAWRDLANLAGTTETLRNLTDLAETCVDITLELLYQDQCTQLGVPLDANGNEQRLVVLGMGKLGGYELNYSSDVDLIFSFAEEGEIAGGRSLAISQFFVRLGQRFIKLITMLPPMDLYSGWICV